MSDQNAYKFLTEMSNCLKIFHEKWQFLSISDQNITLFIPGAAVMSASPSEKLYAGPLYAASTSVSISIQDVAEERLPAEL